MIFQVVGTLSEQQRQTLWALDQSQQHGSGAALVLKVIDKGLRDRSFDFPERTCQRIRIRSGNGEPGLNVSSHSTRPLSV